MQSAVITVEPHPAMVCRATSGCVSAMALPYGRSFQDAEKWRAHIDSPCSHAELQSIPIVDLGTVCEAAHGFSQQLLILYCLADVDALWRRQKEQTLRDGIIINELFHHNMTCGHGHAAQRPSW